jgi:hypothetical protein
MIQLSNIFKKRKPSSIGIYVTYNLVNKQTTFSEKLGIGFDDIIDVLRVMGYSKASGAQLVVGEYKCDSLHQLLHIDFKGKGHKEVIDKLVQQVRINTTMAYEPTSEKFQDDFNRDR